MTAQADDFQLIQETVYHWSAYEPTVKCDLSCTALRVESGLVVFDPVPLEPAAWNRLTADAPLRAILLTNGNHARYAETLRRRYRVPVVTAPAARRDLQEIKPDVVLLETELLYGISARPIPGATLGETAFFGPRGVLVLGDAVIHTDPAKGLELLPDKYCVDPGQNRESLRQLLVLDFHLLAMAHGTPVTEKAAQKLRDLLESRA